MEINLEEIITEICKDNEMEDDEIKEIVKKLQKHLFKKLKHVKNLTETFWKELDLPMNLFYLLKEKYHCIIEPETKKEISPILQEVPTKNDNSQSNIEPEQNCYNNNTNSLEVNKNNIEVKSNNIEININNIDNIEIKETNNLSIKFRKDLLDLFNEINNINISEKIFKKIFEIINNIIQYPQEEKYKRINMSKFLEKYNYNSISKLFLNIFKYKDKDYIILKEDSKDILNTIFSDIIKFIKENKMKIETDSLLLKNKEINSSILVYEENNNLTNDNIKKKNQPIKGSIEILSSKKSKIKYYKYPHITFTSSEENESKVVLLIGKTGDGKSTFINAIVNIYLGIQFDDNFRYLLINNENEDQRKSITKNITVFNIRPKKGLNFPPLKIIDTPGFGDTEGFEEDKKNIVNFKNLFEKQLCSINSICYIVKAPDCRVSIHEEYIFKSIIGLFAENVKENFFVGVTHFCPLNSSEIPNIIENSLSSKNSFYHKYILEKNNLSEDNNLESKWYFSSNNKIIFDNTIEGNSMEKLIWNKTVEEIKFYIEKKVKNSKNKKIKESEEVIKNRMELTVQIDGLKNKLERYFKNKGLTEYNKKQKEKYLKEIENNLEFIKKHEEDKEKSISNLDYINYKLREFSEYIIKEKKLVYIKKYTSQDNIICRQCNNNCHINCNCNTNELYDFFCYQFTEYGNCRICNHGKSQHLKIDYIFEQYEEECNVIDRNKIKYNYLEEEINSLEKEQKEEENYIFMINNIIDNLSMTIEKLEEEKINTIQKIKESKTQIKLIEIGIISALEQIKINLDYLRKNSLNKEFSKTIEDYIEELIKEAEEINDLDKKKNYEIFRKIFIHLIEVENIDISKLTFEKYEEIKNGILSKEESNE